MTEQTVQTSSLRRFLAAENLIWQILVGLIVGIFAALYLPALAAPLPLFGTLFVGALKAIAPILVCILVTRSVAGYQHAAPPRIGSVIVLYIVGTLLASFLAVAASYLFPVTIELHATGEELSPPSSLVDVFNTLLGNMVANPVQAIANGNYIGILFWSILFGIGLRGVHSDAARNWLDDLVTSGLWVMRRIIRFAPLGIMGLVADAVLSSGLEGLLSYGKLLFLLIGVMLLMAFVVNPGIVWAKIRRNPYPLVLTCLRESGTTAFFTRSSAANIPVNLALAEKLRLDRSTYTVTIPLGATINMEGAAITIAVLTLAAVNSLDGYSITFGTALLLSIVSAIGACGASGVAGGSLLLIPMAASLFGIPEDIATQIIGVGFVISVLQDSCETALNSSTDVLFTAAAAQTEESIDRHDEIAPPTTSA